MNAIVVNSVIITFSRKSIVPGIYCILFSKSIIILSQIPGIMGKRRLRRIQKGEKENVSTCQPPQGVNQLVATPMNLNAIGKIFL